VRVKNESDRITGLAGSTGKEMEREQTHFSPPSTHSPLFSCPSCSSCYPVLFSSSSLSRKRRQDTRIGRINRIGRIERGQTPVSVSAKVTAKYWLDPIRLAASNGFSRKELFDFESIIHTECDRFRRFWDDFFGN
jgi:hypothetical protein